MLDPLVILQRARSEALAAAKGEDWRFVFDLVSNAIGHQIGLPSFVEITHQQPVVAVLDAAEEIDEPRCDHDKCDTWAATCCDQCNRYFCSDHGTPGGDRETQDVGMVAYPSLCWNCGGFDAGDDEEDDRDDERDTLANLGMCEEDFR